MQVQFNGQKAHCSVDRTTLETFLEKLSINQSTPGIAVAVNDRIISRPEWPALLLGEGDRIEVVQAVQGG